MLPSVMGPGHGVMVMGHTWMQLLHRLQRSGRTSNGRATRRSLPRPTRPRDLDCQISSQTRTHLPHRTQSFIRIG